ncbi:MAG TPA: glutathione S-transferase family protein [Alphaproteobacteria bacterium]|nr:glutathione S-transferase family protein [Alphaproteobacteria bacterium]
MYKLFSIPGSCSMAVHVILNEVGQKVELLPARDAKGEKTPELMKANPRGQVPTLMVDNKIMTEGGAIISYLCDKYESDLLPKSGWERAQALQWLMICNASLHPSYSRTNWLKRNGGTEEQIKASRAGAQAIWDQVEECLNEKGPYLCGSKPTAADILLAVIGNWADKGVYTYGPKTKELFKNISARPAYQQALAEEQVEYKAAA